MNQKRGKVISPKKVEKKVSNLPSDLKQLVIDTKRYKEKASSTEILKSLRYQAN